MGHRRRERTMLFFVLWTTASVARRRRLLSSPLGKTEESIPPPLSIVPSDEEMDRRRVVHRALLELDADGVISSEDVLDSGSRLVSEFNDPLATGSEKFVAASRSLRLGLRPESAPSYDNFTATQSFSFAGVPGNSRVSFSPRTGKVLEHRLTLGLGRLGPIRNLLLNSVDYENLADASENAIFALSSRIKSPPTPSARRTVPRGGDARPDADAVGTPNFEAYEKCRAEAFVVLDSLSKSPEDQIEDIFATDVVVYGLSGERLFANRREMTRVIDATKRLLYSEAEVTPTRFEPPVLHVEVSSRSFQISAALRVQDAKIRAVRINQVAVGSDKRNRVVMRPSAVASLIMGSGRSAADGGAPSSNPCRKVEERDAAASFKIVTTLKDKLPDIEARTVEPLLHSLAASDDLRLTGLLGETLLNGKREVANAFKAAFALLPLTIRLDKAEIELPQTDLRLTFQISGTTTTFLAVCRLCVRDAKLRSVDVVDLRNSDGSRSAADIAAFFRRAVLTAMGRRRPGQTSALT